MARCVTTSLLLRTVCLLSLRGLSNCRNQGMLIYVDESGDLGFTGKATKFFVVAYVACDQPFMIE